MRGGNRRGQSARMERDLNCMAEHMAETGDGFVKSGTACGMDKTRAKGVWRTMRKRLGWQAA